MPHRHSATRHPHHLAESTLLNGHATLERGLTSLNLFELNGFHPQSRVLLQRPAAQVEPFATGAGLGYVARRPLDMSAALLPDQSPFLGGFEFWNFRVPPAGILVALLSRHGSPAWRIRGNAGSGSRYFGLWLLPRSSFSASIAPPKALAEFASLSFRVTANNRNHFAARFVVQDGEHFFLSRSATDRAGRFTLFGANLSEQHWAAYDPFRDLRANITPEGWTSYSSLAGGASLLPFDTSTSQLNDVQAIGLYVEAVNRSSNGDRCLEWDELNATAAR